MKKILGILLCLLLASCASTELANKARPMNPSAQENKVEVSSEMVQELSDPYNILIQINFTNKGGNWVRIDSAELDLTTTDKAPYNIIVGKDLITWAQSKDEEQKIRQQNQEVGTAAAVLGGTALALAGAASGSSDLATVGSAAVIGGATAGTVNELKKGQQNAHGVQKVPEGHLYAPFSVPSMSLTKRWILVNVPTGRIAPNGKLTLKTVEGEIYTYALKIVE